MINRALLFVVSLLLAGSASAEDAVSVSLLPETIARRVDRSRLMVGRAEVGVIAIEGSTAMRGFAVAILDVDISRLLSTVRDYENYDHFMPYVIASSAVSFADHEIVSHQTVDVPWPFKNRKFSVRVGPVIRDNVGDLQRLQYSWHYIPKSGNIRDTSGSWTFVPQVDGKTLACFTVMVDLGLLLPKWLIDVVTKSALPDVLESVRRRAVAR